VQRRSPLLAAAEGFTWFGRRAYRVGKVLGKVLLVLGLVALCGWGGQWAVRHVVSSPRFALRHIALPDTRHLTHEELLERVALAPGQSLLAVDTDAVAARLATHPFVSRVKVSRSLPSTLRVEVEEREPVALAAMDGLYLLEASGHPFKRASLDETEGLPVLTGISRQQYAELRAASEAAFRAALGVLQEYRRKATRPPVGEVAIDPRFGFSLFLLEGGGEIRLGQKDLGKKLAQLDQIFEAVSTKESGGPSALRVVHLDLQTDGRVPVLLRGAEIATAEKKTKTSNHR
jgi:cell division protein FtsQ